MEMLRTSRSRLRQHRVPINLIIVSLMTLFFFVSVYDYRNQSLCNSLVIETTTTSDEGLLPGLDDCPSLSPKLSKHKLKLIVNRIYKYLLLIFSVGRAKVKTRIPPINETHPIFKYVTMGGHYEPSECQSIYKVAIIVPYRQRVQHLSTFLHHIHPFLQRQQIAYTIFLIEQCDR